jgi:hypothetical protein
LVIRNITEDIEHCLRALGHADASPDGLHYISRPSETFEFPSALLAERLQVLFQRRVQRLRRLD